MRFGMNLFETSAQVALDGTADRLTFAPGIPIMVVRFGYWVTVLLDNTPNGVVLALDKNDDIASPVRTELAIMTAPTVDQVIGTIAYMDVDPGVRFVPGEELILEVKTAATAGDGRVFFEYTPLSWADMPSSGVHLPVSQA